MKTPPFPRTALVLLLTLTLALWAPLPALGEPTPQAPLLSADFGSSQWQLLEVQFEPDSSQAILSILWRNTGANPTSFSWSYTLVLTQGERRCQPLPLPPAVSGGDPSAWVAPGEEQQVRLGFLVRQDQGPVLLRLSESFGQGYTPLSATYSPATGELTDYTPPHPKATVSPPATVTPLPEPEPSPLPDPDPTQVPPGEATAIPLPIPEGESPSIPLLLADFPSSALQVLYINVSEDSGAAVLYLQWQNTGAYPTSFDWAYDLSLTQNGRRCQPLPLPQDVPSDDPQALVQPGEVQFISQAFSLPDPGQDFQALLRESFSGNAGPLLLTYSPATRQITEYTLPQGEVIALPQPEPSPVPQPEPELSPVPEPEPTPLPAPVTGDSFLLEGRIPFGITARRLMGLMGRLADDSQTDMLTFLDMEYASLPADWTFFLDKDEKLNEMFLLFHSPAYQDPQELLDAFDQVDAYLASFLGPADLDHDLAWKDETAPHPEDLSPAAALEQGLQELTSNWYPQGMTVTHVMGTNSGGLLHFVLFFR